MGGITLISILVRLFGTRARKISSIQVLPARTYHNESKTTDYVVTLNGQDVTIQGDSGYLGGVNDSMSLETLLTGFQGNHLLREGQTFYFNSNSQDHVTFLATLEQELAPIEEPGFRMSAELEAEWMRVIDDALERHHHDQLLYIDPEGLSAVGRDRLHEAIEQAALQSQDVSFVLEVAQRDDIHAKSLFAHFLTLNPSMEQRIDFIRIFTNEEWANYHNNQQ